MKSSKIIILHLLAYSWPVILAAKQDAVAAISIVVMYGIIDVCIYAAADKQQDPNNRKEAEQSAQIKRSGFSVAALFIILIITLTLIIQ